MRVRVSGCGAAALCLALLAAPAALADAGAKEKCARLWKQAQERPEAAERLWASCGSERDESGAGLRLMAAHGGQWEWLKRWGVSSPEALKERDARGNSALHAAASSKIAGGGWVAREWAAAGGALDEKNKEGRTALGVALMTGGPGGDELARELLRLGASPASSGPAGESALHYIASARGPEQASWLGAKADVKARSAAGLTPLEVAIAQDNGPMARWLVEKGAPLTDKNKTPLAYLAAGKPRALEAMLKAAPAEAKRRGPGGQTLLHAAVMAEPTPNPFEGADKKPRSERGQEASALRLLLSLGLDPNAKDDRGITPVMLAVAQGKASSLEVLLRAGADLCAVDNQGFPAWRMANSLSGPERLRKIGRCQ